MIIVVKIPLVNFHFKFSYFQHPLSRDILRGSFRRKRMTNKLTKTITN
nr:MAG TPA: hypothetical protein [Caudoviricetes sp.]